MIVTALTALLLVAPPPVHGICPGTVLVVEYKPAGYAVFFHPPLLELAGVTPSTFHDDGVCGRPDPGVTDRSALRVRDGGSVSLVCRTRLPYGIRVVPPARGRAARMTAFTATGRAIVEAVLGRSRSAIAWDGRSCRRA